MGDENNHTEAGPSDQTAAMRSAETGTAAMGAAVAGPSSTGNGENGSSSLTGQAHKTPFGTGTTSATDAAAVFNSHPVDQNLPSDLASLALQKEALQRQAAVFESQARIPCAGNAPLAVVTLVAPRLRSLRPPSFDFWLHRRELVVPFLAGPSPRPSHQDADRPHRYAFAFT